MTEEDRKKTRRLVVAAFFRRNGKPPESEAAVDEFDASAAVLTSDRQPELPHPLILGPRTYVIEVEPVGPGPDSVEHPGKSS
jgi:hypothetical protein